MYRRRIKKQELIYEVTMSDSHTVRQSTASREKKYNELRKNTGVSASTQHIKPEHLRRKNQNKKEFSQDGASRVLKHFFYISVIDLSNYITFSRLSSSWNITLKTAHLHKKAGKLQFFTVPVLQWYSSRYEKKKIINIYWRILFSLPSSKKIRKTGGGRKVPISCEDAGSGIGGSTQEVRFTKHVLIIHAQPEI